MMRAALGTAVVTALLSTGCSAVSSEAVERALAHGYDKSHVVELGASSIATRRSTGKMLVEMFYQDAEGNWRSTEVARADVVPGTNSANVVSGSGLGLEWNTLVYGTAEDGVTTVEVPLLEAPEGGEVIDGMWVIASSTEVSPRDIKPEYLDASGNRVTDP